MTLRVALVAARAARRPGRWWRCTCCASGGARTRGARFANPALLPNLVDRAPGWRRHLPLAILLVALAALIVGVARPHATRDACSARRRR